MKKLVALLCTLALAVVVLAGCGGNEAKDTAKDMAADAAKVVVGATAKPHAEIGSGSAPAGKRGY